MRYLNLDRVSWAWWRQLDLYVLLALLLTALGAWAFIELADEVREGTTLTYDEWVIRALRDPQDPADPLGPRWLEEMGRDLTALGGVVVLSLVTVAVGGFLLLRRRYGNLLLMAAAVVGGAALSFTLKSWFDRPRPDLVPHLSHVATASFPSGHSMLSAAVYLTLGALSARLFQDLKIKMYFLGVALTITLLVGGSRVYLGVHYPTDVLAGWSAGLSWALLAWLVARFLQRRGAVEPSVPEDPPGSR